MAVGKQLTASNPGVLLHAAVPTVTSRVPWESSVTFDRDPGHMRRECAVSACACSGHMQKALCSVSDSLLPARSGPYCDAHFTDGKTSTNTCLRSGSRRPSWGSAPGPSDPCDLPSGKQKGPRPQTEPRLGGTPAWPCRCDTGKACPRSFICDTRFVVLALAAGEAQTPPQERCKVRHLSLSTRGLARGSPQQALDGVQNRFSHHDKHPRKYASLQTRDGEQKSVPVHGTGWHTVGARYTLFG